MEICPKCGRYMSGHMEMFFGAARLVCICLCGYSSKQTETGMAYSNETKSTGGAEWNNLYFRE